MKFKKGKEPHVGDMGQVRIWPSVSPCALIKVTGINLMNYGAVDFTIL